MKLIKLTERFLKSGLKRRLLFALCIAVIGTGIIVFAKLANDTLSADDFYLWDGPIINLIVWLRNPILNRLMLLVTLAGNWPMIVLGTILVEILLVKANNWRYFWTLLITNIVAVIFIDLSKNMVGRLRPPKELALIPQGNYSFPSGHSYFAGVYYGLITYFWVRYLKNRWWQLGFILLGSGGIMALAISRVYLGVHWPTDVIAGLAVGGVWLAATVLFLEFERLFGAKKLEITDRKKMYQLIAAVVTLWLVVLTGYYLVTTNNKAVNLGTKIIRPTIKEAMARTKTAAAARLRMLVVSS